MLLYVASALYCAFVFVAWAWLADPQIDVSEFVTSADCLHTRMFEIRRCVPSLSKRAVPTSLSPCSAYCTLFIVLPGFVFLALGWCSSDIQFLRLSDCDADSGTHVAVVLRQSRPSSGCTAQVTCERKFVQQLRGGACTSFDFFGVRYIKASTSRLHADRDINNTERLPFSKQLPSECCRLFSCIADELMTGATLSQLNDYARNGSANSLSGYRRPI